MSSPHDLSASIHQRLLMIARARHLELEYLLTRFALERLLYRLGNSPYADHFILKGATLFAIWTDQPHRSTRDLDLLGYGAAALPHLEGVFRELCLVPVAADGLVFDPASVSASPIREAQEYEGGRVNLLARLGQARLSLQVDVGFGDAVTPAPIEVTIPTLLDLPAPRIRAYTRDTVVAEKFQALVTLGMANSRMKDFYDLWTLAQRFDFHGETLTAALAATFTRRRTDVPVAPPLALTATFGGDPVKQAQWRAFVRRGRLSDDPPDLIAVVASLTDFLLPPMQALAAGHPFTQRWPSGGPWRPQQEEAPT